MPSPRLCPSSTGDHRPPRVPSRNSPSHADAIGDALGHKRKATAAPASSVPFLSAPILGVASVPTSFTKGVTNIFGITPMPLRGLVLNSIFSATVFRSISPPPTIWSFSPYVYMAAMSALPPVISRAKMVQSRVVNLSFLAKGFRPLNSCAKMSPDTCPTRWF
jgi:hypothetical protein